MPRIQVTAKPNAKQNHIEKIGAGHYRISIKAAPDEGKANQAIIEILHDFFNIPKSKIKLIRGHKSRVKVIDLDDEDVRV